MTEALRANQISSSSGGRLKMMEVKRFFSYILGARANLTIIKEMESSLQNAGFFFSFIVNLQQNYTIQQKPDQLICLLISVFIYKMFPCKFTYLIRDRCTQLIFDSNYFEQLTALNGELRAAHVYSLNHSTAQHSYMMT